MRKKLIEVALPLEAINRESAREKSIRHGHPSTLHLWWARRPLAACRAVLFASLVDDPSSLPVEFPTEELQEKERQRLFGIIEELVKWENSNNERVLEAARKEILRSTDGNPPPILDPFCGGGSIPLEAQRLGLEAHASDLNPVAVLITKALIEIPPKFADRPPVNPDARLKRAHAWKAAQGLAEDVRFYGEWMKAEAQKRLSHLYPDAVDATKGQRRVIAWLWARTVVCPNPACGATMPLLRTFVLSSKPKTAAYLRPRPVGSHVEFDVQRGTPSRAIGTVGRRGAECLQCGQAVELAHIRIEAKAQRMGAQLVAMVLEDANGRSYSTPDSAAIAAARRAATPDVVTTRLPEKALGFRVQGYGMQTHASLFTDRQLVALSTLSDLVNSARERAEADAASFMSRGETLEAGGDQAAAYGDAVATYLAFAVDKSADYWSALCSWHSSGEKMRNTFGRQAVPMVWDFAEANPFSGSTGNWSANVEWTARVLENLVSARSGRVTQRDAATLNIRDTVVSTDPPYYDNIGYADLSDFFYVWLRRSLKDVYPQLFSTLLVPKSQELVAEPFRHGGSDAAARFFETGMASVFTNVRRGHHDAYPMTVIYAFKQSEDDEDDAASEGRASTGWETMLDAMLTSGWVVDGTWPLRSELSNRMRGLASNALASSILLVCRVRPSEAPIATRKELIAALKRELPIGLKRLQHSNIAAVDLAQAAIGPGMAVFSRYSKVIEADGSPMRVRSALQLINQALDEVLSEQESEYDADTQWAVAWFDQFGMKEAAFGEAETLSKAKNTSVNGLVEAGVLRAAKGKVRLLSREELSNEWDPSTDSRLTIWEVTQHLIRRLQNGGEQEAAALLRKVGGMGEIARDLAYRLYSVCERKGWTDEAIAYNSLVVAWPEISKLASEASASSVQDSLL